MPARNVARPKKNVLLWFGLRFIICLAAVAALWPLLIPAYNSAIVACARVVFRLVEQPNVTDLVARGDEVLVLRSAGAQLLPFSVFTRYFYVALVPLLALLLSVPGIGWARRARYVALGIGMLAGFHVLYVVFAVRLAYVAIGLTEVDTARRQFYEWVQVLFRTVWDIIAILIWAGLTLRHWRSTVSASRRQ